MNPHTDGSLMSDKGGVSNHWGKYGLLHGRYSVIREPCR